jgi:excisionase family DNA binding protein
MDNTSPHEVPCDLITPKEAAKLVKVHLATLYRFLADGRLPCWTRAGTRKFVSRAAVLGLFAPPANVPPDRVASHQEAVERLKGLGWM